MASKEGIPAAARWWLEMMDLEEIDVIRVDGRAECPICGRVYYEHPWDEVNVSGLDGEHYLRIGCDGKRLKT